MSSILDSLPCLQFRHLRKADLSSGIDHAVGCFLLPTPSPPYSTFTHSSLSRVSWYHSPWAFCFNFHLSPLLPLVSLSLSSIHKEESPFCTLALKSTERQALSFLLNLNSSKYIPQTQTFPAVLPLKAIPSVTIYHLPTSRTPILEFWNIGPILKHGGHFQPMK